MQRTNGQHGEITYPECGRKFQVPGSEYPKDLPANFRMNSLLDVMAIQKCNIAVETAKKQMPKVLIALDVAPSGATIALQLITF